MQATHLQGPGDLQDSCAEGDGVCWDHCHLSNHYQPTKVIRLCIYLRLFGHNLDIILKCVINQVGSYGGWGGGARITSTRY